ncbi:MAG: sensor histidine kinase [Desulfitobacteriaceae bacterium]
MEHKPESLFELIEKDKLVRIIKTFTKATDITIDINDAEGLPVVQHDYFYGFCRSVRSTAVGLRRCIDSNAWLGFQTVEQGGSCTGKCHAGVVLMSVPILVEGKFYGSITCGQMHLNRPGAEEIAGMLEATADLGLDPEYLSRTFQEIQAISLEKSQGAVGLIQFVVNYIVELMVRAKMQEELSREKLKAAEDARLIVELEHTLQKAELKNLQAQIKPHFLFNTLNTISSLVTLGENREGLNTLFALSDLLRHNVDHPGELVTLREELHYIESYLLIQKNRFGNRLEVTIEVPEDMQERLIPFLSLQPLVENACIHGLEPKEGPGHLWIKGEKLTDRLEITVMDDGVGMPPHNPAFTGGENKRVGQGIGLRNVHQRLQLQFGREFGVNFISAPGLTTVKLLMPAG